MLAARGLTGLFDAIYGVEHAGFRPKPEREAFETIFKYYGPKVRAYMAKLARDGQAAEELMQETMLAVWNKAEQFDPARGNVSSWIFTIARNQRIDAFRREKRPTFDPSDPAFVPDDVPPADVEPSPYFALLAKLAREHGLGQLSMGMSGDYETAVRMGATHVRIGSALFGAR